MGDQDDQNDQEGQHTQQDPTNSDKNGGPVTKVPDEDSGGKHGKK